VNRNSRIVLALAVAAIAVWIVSCAIGTRQEFWFRPTDEIHSTTNSHP
jgi:hypothetical protein